MEACGLQIPSQHSRLSMWRSCPHLPGTASGREGSAATVTQTHTEYVPECVDMSEQVVRDTHAQATSSPPPSSWSPMATSTCKVAVSGNSVKRGVCLTKPRQTWCAHRGGIFADAALTIGSQTLTPAGQDAFLMKLSGSDGSVAWATAFGVRACYDYMPPDGAGVSPALFLCPSRAQARIVWRA